jgi:hypothetical protein
MCPEALDKAFACKANRGFSYDYRIDTLSGIYQLGGTFWYILQEYWPAGRLHAQDFKSLV